MPEHRSLRGNLAARPAMRLAMLLAVGILLSDMVDIRPSITCALLILCVLIAAVCTLVRSNGLVTAVALQCAAVLTGWALHSVHSSFGVQTRLDAVTESDSMSLTGTVIAPPTPTRSGWSLIVRPQRLILRDSVTHVESDAIVYVKAKRDIQPEPPAMAGERVSVFGVLDRFPRSRNPGEFDYGLTLSMNGIGMVMRADSVVLHEKRKGELSFRSAVSEVQQTLYAWLDQLHPPEHAAFLKGIMLGYRAELSDELKVAFQATGTVHILAVSGSNVALIALVALACIGALRVGRTTVVIMSIVSILVYMVLTGSSPSVVRATIMGGIVVAAVVFGRRTDAVQSLAVAATILLLIDPRNLFDVGFQLSFVSVASLIAGVPAALEWTERFPEEVRESQILSGIVQLMCVTVVAQLGTLPLTASYFGRVSIVALLVNVIVVPLSGLNLLVGVSEMAFMPFCAACASVYATLNDALMYILLGLVRRASAVPFAAIDIGMPGPTTVCLLYALLMLLLVWKLPRLRAIALCAATLFLNIAVWSAATASWKRQVILTTLDVGQGDAHVMQTMDGRVIMVDAGPTVEAAERTILPWMKRKGIDMIDLLVLTHPHADHIAGTGVLLDHIPVRTLAVADTSTYPVWLRTRAWKANVRMINVQRGDRIEPDSSMRVYVVHPGSGSIGSTTNNRSVVVKVVIGSSAVLMTGDAEEEAELIFLSRYGKFLEAEVLKVAHHGSVTGTSGELLDIVRPRIALVPVGWRNKFHHPSPERMQALRERNIQTFATTLEGAIQLVTHGNGWLPTPWR